MRILFVVFLAVIILLGLSGIVLIFSSSDEPKILPTPLVFQEQKSGENFSAIVEQSDQENHRRFLACTEKRCDISPNQTASFSYHNDFLIKKAGREDQTIVAKNQLVAPRGLFSSPDGKKVAYWLDNIHDNKKELTELWLYDSEVAGTRLLVEHVVRPDVVTEPRWNRAGTHLWYVADSGQKEEKIELVVVQINPTAVSARFVALKWRDIKDIAENGTMDISFTGRSLALAQPNSFGRSVVTVLHEGTPPRPVTVPGEVTFMQWTEDSDLLYAIQNKNRFTFWRARSTVHEQLNYKLAPIPTFGEQAQTKIISIQTQPASQDAGISTILEDAELAAFIEINLPTIIGKPAQPIRLITTSQPNVVYVDLRSEGAERRILLTIRDAIHPEWSIQARYEPAGGEWRKVQGGGLADPAPLRVYEWEESLRQWILKSVAGSK